MGEAGRDTILPSFLVFLTLRFGGFQIVQAVVEPLPCDYEEERPMTPTPPSSPQLSRASVNWKNWTQDDREDIPSSSQSLYEAQSWAQTQGNTSTRWVQPSRGRPEDGPGSSRHICEVSASSLSLQVWGFVLGCTL